jgi:hypothetical protein
MGLDLSGGVPALKRWASFGRGSGAVVALKFVVGIPIQAGAEWQRAWGPSTPPSHSLRGWLGCAQDDTV